MDRLAAGAPARFRPGSHHTRVATTTIAGAPVLLLKPQTFVNLSGPPVAQWLETLELPLARLVVVHDELDLPLGRLRIAARSGPAGHRGVASIQARLQTRAFPRVRVGIGRPGEGEDAAQRVLETFSAVELPILRDVLERAAGAVQSILRDGLATAMNRYNARVVEAGASV
jgi:PTH1 family peptidyl-tRNA hydrolase